LADLEAEQARLAAEAEQLRAQAEEARRREHARQEKERDEHAARLLDAHDDQATDVPVKAAEKRLREAIVDDPVYSAAADLMAAATANYEYRIEVVAAAQRLNRQAPATPSPALVALPDLIDKIIKAEASARADDLRESRGRPHAAASTPPSLALAPWRSRQDRR